MSVIWVLIEFYILDIFIYFTYFVILYILYYTLNVFIYLTYLYILHIYKLIIAYYMFCILVCLVRTFSYKILLLCLNRICLLHAMLLYLAGFVSSFGRSFC